MTVWNCCCFLDVLALAGDKLRYLAVMKHCGALRASPCWLPGLNTDLIPEIYACFVAFGLAILYFLFCFVLFFVMILRPVGTGFGVAVSQITNSLWVRIHHSGRVWLLLECITFRWDFAPSCIMFWFLLEFLWFGFNGLKMHFYTLCKKCAELNFQSTQIILNDNQRYQREYFLHKNHLTAPTSLQGKNMEALHNVNYANAHAYI